jgi:hypothetical protein
MNFLGLGVEASAEFLHRIRRVETKSEFFRICEDHLDHETPMTLSIVPE